MSKHQIGYCLFFGFSILFWLGYFLYDWSIIIFLIGFIIWLSLLVNGSLFIRLNYHLKAINSVKTDEKKVTITFDDGPTEFTLKALDLLKKHQQKATFFCIGNRVEEKPDLLQKILEEGHSIGNHTYSHSERIGFKSTVQMVEEIEKTQELIQAKTGFKTRLFRPPYGVTNPNIKRAIEHTGHLPIGWNIRSLDTVIKSEEKVLKRITKRLKPGSIILLHDTSDKTINVLEHLLIHLEKNQYKSVTIEDLI